MGRGRGSGDVKQARPWSEAVDEFRANKEKSVSAGGERKNFSRLHTLVPLGDMRNKNFSQKEPHFPANMVDNDRYERHGWGVGTSVPNTVTGRWSTRERDEWQDAQDESLRRRTIMKPVPGCGPGTGPNRPTLKGTRSHLFDHVTMSNPGDAADDTWIGNHLISANEGKAHVPVAGGGTGMFEVLANGESGEDAAPDAWIGNRMVDPTKGKAHPPDPASKQGRKNLFGIVHQKPLEPGEPGHDSWLGHRLVNPAKGKSSKSPFIPQNRDGRKNLFGIIGYQPDAFDDPARPQGRRWAPGPSDDPFSMFPVLQQTEGGPDFRDAGRKAVPPPANYFGRRDLFATIQMNPTVREENYHHGKKKLDVPGVKGIGKGPTMLHHIAAAPGPQHVGRSGHISFHAASQPRA